MSRLPPQPGDLIADRYELEELVGTGGMSTVFRAHDTQLDRRVAIKILHERYAEDPEYLERFSREARAVAQLSHPNIVTVIDRGDDGGSPFIVSTSSSSTSRARTSRNSSSARAGCRSAGRSSSSFQSPTGSPSRTRMGSSTAT